MDHHKSSRELQIRRKENLSDLKRAIFLNLHLSEKCRLYCTNLPEKLQKPDLKLSLYTLFSTYGPVLDVVAVKTPKMRGQAHVVFRDIQASTQAMRALQDFDFFGKEMVSIKLQDAVVFLYALKEKVENSVCEGKIRHYRETRWHV